jgi:hypothetical protein
LLAFRHRQDSQRNGLLEGPGIGTLLVGCVKRSADVERETVFHLLPEGARCQLLSSRVTGHL